MSYPEYLQEWGCYPSAEKQSVYSTTPVDWTKEWFAIGLTFVDNIDTMYVMQMKERKVTFCKAIHDYNSYQVMGDNFESVSRIMFYTWMQFIDNDKSCQAAVLDRNILH